MKQDPDMDTIQKRMMPGELTEKGFLGDDSRNIADMIREDADTVSSLGLSNGTMADRMLYFSMIAEKGLGDYVRTDGDYIVRIDEHRGGIPCPFGDGYSAGKKNTYIENTKLHVHAYWSDLNIHMIEKHGFYEGKGSFFRIDIKKTAQVMGLIK